MRNHIQDLFAKIIYADARYAIEAYEFVLEALSFTQKHFRREHHVSGQELVFGVKELAVSKYGPFAREMLKRWGINAPLDVGHIVFSMIEHGLLSRQEGDTLEDFRLDMDFAKECRKAYQLHLARSVRKLR